MNCLSSVDLFEVMLLSCKHVIKCFKNINNMKILKCSLCNKTFNKAFNLNRHIRKFHPDQADSLTTPKKTFICQCCSILFPTLKQLKVHRKIHNNKAAPVRKDNKCPLCDFSDYQKKYLLAHFIEQHDIALKYSVHTFPSLDEFKAWVTKIENETKARYVKRRKTDITKAGQTIHYYCHRSGNFISESKGLRRLKVLGSHKIDGFCPGEIKLFIKPCGLCEVTFLETHIGHVNELERLPLRQSERETLARKISQNIPFIDILNDTRESADNSQRIHFIKRKDLYNIEQSFKLQGTLTHRNDATIINEIGDDSSILFHKAQETVNNVHPELNPEDFILILMNDQQEEMLNKYGSDCVCLDRIHGEKQNDFELHTLSVLDTDQEGFPCAFLISNRNDEQVMTIFLFYVKQKIGMAVAPKVFMSDIADCCYAAWLNVMALPQLRFYCMWHIDNAWRSNLFKINGKDKQDSVYMSLQAMLHESDVGAFTSLLAQFFKNIYNDPDTVDFGDHFKDNYENTAGQWAFCFRLRYDVDTNRNLEYMHKSIKKLFLSGENVKRLDKAIGGILKFTSEKFLNRKDELGITMEESEIEATVNPDLMAEHAYAEGCDVPEDDDVITDDTVYVRYVHCEDSGNEELECADGISNNSELVEINEADCAPSVDQEKEELEASMVKIIREISSMEQIEVFKALIAPIEPAMKAIENTIGPHIDNAQFQVMQIIPPRRELRQSVFFSMASHIGYEREIRRNFSLVV